MTCSFGVWEARRWRTATSPARRLRLLILPTYPEIKIYRHQFGITTLRCTNYSKYSSMGREYFLLKLTNLHDREILESLTMEEDASWVSLLPMASPARVSTVVGWLRSLVGLLGLGWTVEARRQKSRMARIADRVREGQSSWRAISILTPFRGCGSAAWCRPFECWRRWGGCGVSPDFGVLSGRWKSV